MSLHPDFLTHPIAHRALHGPGAPENSLAAVRAAVAAGFGIEVDVQLSSDGVAMVFHDDKLKRLTGATGLMNARSAAELGTILLLGGDAGIPTLEQVLEAVAGRVPLLIEIKDQDGAMGPDVGPLERAVAKALKGYSGPVAVMSFNPHAIAAVAVAAPDVVRGITSYAWRDASGLKLPAKRRAHLRAIADFDDVGACFISHHWRDLGSPRVAELKSAGVPVLCWTIRSPKEESKAREIADNITFEGYTAPRLA